MVTKVFAVYDLKVLAHMQPFFSESIGGALRAFEDAVNDPQCPFNKHPGDYQLFEIGSFDNKTGLIAPLTPMKLIANAAEFVKVKPGNISLDKVLDAQVAKLNSDKLEVSSGS